jgi:cell volume regulation protein A
MSAYYLIISASVIVVISYLFNILAKRTNIPSVLMLITLGIVLRQIIEASDIQLGLNFNNMLEILGIVGLIMIVLEAALDLELKREKLPIIFKSFLVALIALVGSAFLISVIINVFIDGADSLTALVYAIPLSIMSSAIIIPSVGGMGEDKKEFMVYESTFSDILGIMFFYFLIGNLETANAQDVVFNIVGNILLTVLLSVAASYALVLVFQNLKTQIKLFLIISVLLLLYSIGKIFHLSSLIIILVFGLILNNTNLFFRGKLHEYINEKALKPIQHDFHILTLESAFIVRTFFFTVFGLNINLESLYDPMVALISVIIVALLLVVRFVVLRLISGKDIFPQLFIAPRGLITILLFFSIPPVVMIPGFEPGILLYTILISSIVMSVALIMDSGEKVKVKDVLLSAAKTGEKEEGFIAGVPSKFRKDTPQLAEHLDAEDGAENAEQNIPELKEDTEELDHEAEHMDAEEKPPFKEEDSAEEKDEDL